MGLYGGQLPMRITLQGDGPVSQRVFRGVRRAILDGTFTAGSRLPSTRMLAMGLGVARKGVALAFERLADEGYVHARVGSGTFVCETVPDAGPARSSPRPAKSTTARAHLSEYTGRVLAQSPWPPPGRRPDRGVPFDFHYGTPAISDFPHAVWSRLVGQRIRRASIGTLRYGRTLGYEPLRAAIAEYVGRTRGVIATPDQIVVVNGSQQAVDLITRLLVDSGDRVVIEEPGYQGARQVFVAAGARVSPVPVDDSGLDVARLPRGGPVRLAYVTPSHQFPLGGVLPLGRRLELLRWARATSAYVVEDDYDSEFRYDGPPLEALQGLDRDGRVLYVGTFSKVLFPSLRLAYLIVPVSLVATIASLKFLADYHSPTFEQSVLAQFIAEGHFARHVRRVRRRNGERRTALLDALREHLGSRVDVAGANAGVHLVVWLRNVDASRVDELRRRAADNGVGIYPIAPYYVHPPARAGLLFGYASLNPVEIQDGIRAFAQALAPQRAPSRRRKP